MPLHLQNDARIPMMGFAGPKYKLGNPVLLAINPGGGTDNYHVRKKQDLELFALIQDFRAAHGQKIFSAFGQMSTNYAMQVRTWNLWRIMSPVLDSLSVNIDQVAFVNVFPYRTRNDAKPHAHPLRQALALCTVPLLRALRTKTIVCLGNKAGKAMATAPPINGLTFVVPRTNGDRYLSNDAHTILRNLRDNVAQQKRRE